MDSLKNKFTLKIILSYLVIGSLAAVVSLFLYSEYKAYIDDSGKETLNKKFIETGTLINSVYETDGYSRKALLTEKDEDFELYERKMDSLFRLIKKITNLTTSEHQIKQLDCVRTLLLQKNRNIEQLRLFYLTSDKDSSLDDILKEFKKLEVSMGKNSLESLIKEPNKLSRKERRVWRAYADYLNSAGIIDTNQFKTRTVDSMLIASRFIVSEAKKENSRIRQSLREKENELIRNDLTISEQLRKIIAAFDVEINKINNLEKEARLASIERTTMVLKLAGILGALVILLFSYIVVTDFFKADKFKRNLEQANKYSEDLLKSREQLISTVSHDLKTPLNTIMGYSELVENTPLNEKQKHYIQQISNSSNFIGKLVDDLLDFSKLEAGKLTTEEIPFSLENLINETAKASEDMHKQKNLALHVSIDAAIKNSFFIGDPLRIRQIINNLVGNAFKFTEKGSISISVSERKSDGKFSEIHIAVKDTGIGISKEKQHLIFKEFAQAEEDTGRKFGGYGLGLAISKKLAQLLNGRLEVESDPGEGSIFKLIVPLQRSTHVVQPAADRDHKELSKLRALVFDDDPAMVSLLEEVLAQLGIEGNAFTSFETAENTKTLNYDFVLTDIQMPVLNGFEVLDKLKERKLLGYTSQPVIAMTGSRELKKTDYLEKGFSELLMKPFTKDQFIDALESLFPGKISKTLTPKEKTARDTASNKLYDLSLLLSFIENKEALKSIMLAYFDQTDVDILQLNKAIEQLDYTAIRASSHKMLTMTRQIRAKTIIPILEKLEKATPETASEANLKEFSEKLNAQLNQLLNSLKSEFS
jgi:signal transduction histidine kinase/CheY-like chemotaxis protein